MKYVLFFSGVVLFQMISTAYGSKEFALACAKELGIPEATLKEGPQANMGKPEFRCFVACVMKKDGTLEPGNKINAAVMKAHTAEHFGGKADAVFAAGAECAEQSKGIADECDFVNAINKCIFAKIPDIGKHFTP
ncbi:uncharacterized protein LOC122507947 [Leptopilina heterotoma]|uniref:uncharacterized protein LOC122507947 n=1 Tax=Leptopilina heterotoma TaxID=63436 RepID=UPI001CAA1492|nr:uncharacterized protein LOC122507947 [Leptopilina heterotoma]